EREAAKQRTQWENVIDIFNNRFFVPFKLTANNRVSVILGQEPMLSLGFTFEDGADRATVDKGDLMKVLSTGERKALYVLNIIFEIEVRRKLTQPTIFVVDDIADSFDYKNKYAIVQYLKEIAEDPHFNLIILTHNFDFFRTVNSRFVKYSHCLMAFRDNTGLSLSQASGIKNVFVNDWKKFFFSDPKKKLASIPFIRNIIEYTEGEEDPDFSKLTSLLHWKPDSESILERDLDAIYKRTFGNAEGGAKNGQRVLDIVWKEAKECLTAGESINFENKIVLSIAIRMAAERFMIQRISDPAFVESIVAHQTSRLFERFRQQFPDEAKAIEALERVVLMTPENIHLNSFMYEPILDMSDEHLRGLYRDILALSRDTGGSI
ncbi:MAG: AAA family ATPase, partial [Candidatus Binatia bacterium]